ncbi:dihydroflavonal-4-reductase [Aspergillus bombycis]|uniref:Dihydroflavonal-4-reductase n=1 Tax=Aspergillus bombycis TaxID=109264 RepID=A0A1F7ZWL4_9EURO|nr:dihydroflavonal-4-reductase [Aspergillus bombycis]OGM43827.1 dihydroflavonal-4-reductase [Aspergillus bombycis]
MASETVLITGASGFIATHIVESFLRAGYNVRGTARSEKTANKVRHTFQEYKDKLSFAIVPDVVAAKAFDEAIEGVIGIIHTAAPFQTEVENKERDLMRPAIDGTINLLDSIKRNGPQVRRVIHTSSFADIMDMSKVDRPGHVYTEADWNPMTYAEAINESTPDMLSYCSGKTMAEHAAWDFMATESPPFDLVTICPPYVFGPVKNATASLVNLNTSSMDIYRLMSPMSKPSHAMPPTSVWAWADVRDVAEAHLKAFEIPEAGGQRFLVSGGKYSYQLIADILRHRVAEVRDRVPLGKPRSGLHDVYGTDASKSENVLGLRYRPLEDSIVDAARSLLKLEQAN